jgi:hypothetical protein
MTEPRKVEYDEVKLRELRVNLGIRKLSALLVGAFLTGAACGGWVKR